MKIRREVIMNKEYLTYENKILGQEIERLAKEVEKLEKVNKMLLNSMVTEAHTKETKEIERLNSIINEAIEYIKKHGDYNKSSGCIEELDLYKINELLEILEGE
jgi:sensor c-di-GMP phosphodiesterase-like protein